MLLSPWIPHYSVSLLFCPCDDAEWKFFFSEPRVWPGNLFVFGMFHLYRFI